MTGLLCSSAALHQRESFGTMLTGRRFLRRDGRQVAVPIAACGEPAMNHRIALLLCSTAALLAFDAVGQAATPAESTPTVTTAPQTYAELLEPIPDAAAQLKADDARLAGQPSTRLQLAQYHHHHHHHHSFFGLGFGIGPRPYYGGHCHWAWGRAYWNGYRWVHPRVRVCD